MEEYYIFFNNRLFGLPSLFRGGDLNRGWRIEDRKWKMVIENR
jgi:hypothetical protein